MKACIPKFIHRRVFGFTLAEVLITLTIIGVVAALTIPAVISNVQKDMWTQSMKKTVSALSQATSQIMLDNGGSLVGVFASHDSMMNAYGSKMSFVKTCLANQGPGVCFHDGTNSWHQLDGSSGWANATGNARAIGNDGVLYRFILQDSNCVNQEYKINGANSLCGWIAFDTNGFKGPNTAGRDMFWVEITQKGLVVDGAFGDTRYETNWTTFCNPASTTTYNGITCGHRVMQQGGMNY